MQALAQLFTTKASSDLLKTSDGQRFINNPTCQPKLKVKVNSRYYFNVLNRFNVMNIVKENMDIFDFFTQHFCDEKVKSKKADSRLKHN